MGQDYHYHEVKSIDDLTGYPVDSYGYLLDPVYKNAEGECRQLTSPYGALYYAIGNGDDFVCFDYAILDNCQDGKTRFVLDSSVNSETGSFIDKFEYEVCQLEEASNIALGMTDSAVDWCISDYENPIKHTKKGWNQDVYYFYRSVYTEIERILGKTIPKFSNRQYRFGGKRIDRFCGLSKEK